MSGDEEDLRARFEALKADDEHSVSPFAARWEAARLSAGRRLRMLFGPALAAAVMLLLVAAIAIYVRPSPRPVVEDISRWRSPTASLLKTPGSAFMTDMPRIEGLLIPRVKDKIK